MLLCVGITVLFLLLFFRPVLRDPDHTFFATGGDGLKAYFGALYHVQYDSLSMRSQAMNYPFGEVLPFTDSQPPVVNAIRMASNALPSLGSHTTGLLNLLMLLSLLLGALFLYLILTDHGIDWWYAGIVAAGIAFLSPQLGRMGGHFSLSWVFWIPLTSWLILRFDRTRWLIYSLLLGVTTFLAGFLHFYYIGFIGFLLLGYWLFRFLWYRKASTFWYRDLLHVFLQFILPVLLLQLLVQIHDDVTDRTTWPFGFDGSTAHPVGIFLPSGAPWAFVPRIFTVFRHISWESHAYIGTAALAGSLAGLFFIGRRIRRRQPFWKVSPVRSMNVLFWVSFGALLFSFGIPFIFGLEFLYDYLGPFRQLRVLARFSWLFFYFINLVVFASLFRKAFAAQSRWWWKLLAGAAVSMLLFEAVFNTRGIAVHLNNRIPLLEDTENLLPENQWVRSVSPSDFQAILPLPWFHVGSENIWIDGSEEGKETAMVASLKTGLPLAAAMLSRTSLSQTFMSHALLLEPLQRLELADYLPTEKPLLVLVMKDYAPAPSEQWLLRGTTPITETDKFALLSLPVGHIKSHHETWRRKIIDQFNTSRLYRREGFLLSDSAAFFRVHGFDDLGSAETLRGTGAFTFTGGEKLLLSADTLTGVPAGQTLTSGFWICHYQEDATLRTRLDIVQKEAATGEVVSENSFQLFRHLKAYQGDWALVEFDLITKTSGEILEMYLHHDVLRKGEFTADELLIRQQGVDVWLSTDRTLLYNGRTYIRRQAK
jgi:hypothetical protein